MAKYPKIEEPVFITNVELIRSYHGGEVWEVQLMGIRTQQRFKTYADPQNVNWSHWHWIVEVAQRKGVVLTGCKLKDPARNIINADSQVVPEYVVTKQELANILEEYWRSQDTFSKLFH